MRLATLLLSICIFSAHIDSIAQEQTVVGDLIRIELVCPNYTADKIHNSRGSKFDIYPNQLLINGMVVDVKSMHTRGNNTLLFRRKSFSISLEEDISLFGLPVKKIAANSLAMDRNYWRNRLSFRILETIGLFPLGYSFGEVKINDNSQGIYMVVQKPDDYTKNIDSPLLIRTGYDGTFEIDYSKGDNKDLIKQFKMKEKMAKKLSGQALYDSLNQIFNMEKYFQWLTVNFFLLNGDYTDEVYFYYDVDKMRFQIIPWDYDDILATQPHEGWTKRNSTLTRELIFSSESDFDRIIDKDEFLYKKYLSVFKETTEQLNEELLKVFFEDLYTELMPLFRNDDMISQSQYDQFGLTSVDDLSRDLQLNYEYLRDRRKVIMAKLEEELASLSGN